MALSNIILMNERNYRNQTIFRLVSKLSLHVSLSKKIQIICTFFLMIIASFSEVFAIGSVIPFLGILTDPSGIYENPNFSFFIDTLNVSSPEELILPLVIIFIIATSLAMFLRILLLWVSTRVSFGLGADLSLLIFNNYLFQNYESHTSQNSSELVNIISNKTNQLINVIMMILNFFGALFMIFFILGALIYINPYLTIIAFSAFSFIYFLIIFFTRTTLFKNSIRVADESTKIVKIIQEAIGGIREIIISSSQKEFFKIFVNSDLPLRRAQGNNIIIANSPRFLIEGIGMIVLSLLSLSLYYSSAGLIASIPTLGALVLGTQRLLPVLQQAYGAVVSVKAGKASVADVIKFLEKKLNPELFVSDTNKINFFKEISLHDLNFKYVSSKDYILKDVNLKIYKGETIGIVGKTGSGKTTLIDLIMGLLSPTKGKVKIDSKEITKENVQSWYPNITHVSQEVFIGDLSIIENISFGINKKDVNFKKIIDSAEKAQIHEDIKNLPMSYDTIVGERGLRLSGGQKQRLGLARALYKNSEVIILDEATSALDEETEEAVMKNFKGDNNNLTKIIVTHRKSTLKYCDRIIEISDGKILNELTYDQLIKRKTNYFKDMKDAR